MVDPQDRIYCPQPRCLTFIGAVDMDEQTTTCTNCFFEICNRCRRESHTSLIACRPLDEDPEVLSVGQREGWQRCYSCRAMVERTEGCNHLICRCSSEWCYKCGKQWKPRACACSVVRDENVSPSRALFISTDNLAVRGVDVLLSLLSYCITIFVLEIF